MGIQKKFILINLLLLFVLITPTHAEKWVTLQSKQFKLIISENFLDQGLHILNESERALEQLKNVFSEIPKSKILIVVDHRTNISNGLASYFPYPHIVLYPALPTTYSSIGEYNEWVYELVLHELTHFLTFKPNHGVYKPIQWVFGNLFAPNFVLLPAWFHEGLAVSLESHLTLGGRLRSENYKEMYKVLANKLASGAESLDRINERYIPSFPYGQRPYFFGSIEINQGTQKLKPKNLDNLIQGFSRSLPPYNIRSSAVKNLNQSFRSIRKSVTAPTEIENSSFKFNGYNPIWIDNTHFLTLQQTNDLNYRVLKYDLNKKNNQPKTLTKINETNRLVISKDKNILLFDQSAAFNKMYTTTDVYTYNIKDKKKKRLTYGAKLREATFSKNEKKILAVQTDLANTQLVELKLNKPEEIQTIYKSNKLEDRISSPVYYGNSDIIFLEKPQGKPILIKKFNLKTKASLTINLPNSFTNFYWIEKTTDSEKPELLLHAKETGKPRQFYLLDSNFKPTQITSDPIGVRSVALQDKKILISRITSKNYKTSLSEDYSKINNSKQLEDFEINLSKDFIFNEQPNLKTQSTQKKYSFWPYMIPQYWYPFITPNYGGFSSKIAVSASTGGSDPLGINSYSATLKQDTISNRLSGGASLFHVNKKLIWSLAGYQIESPLTEDISRTFQYFAISSRYDLGHSRTQGGAFTFSLSHTDAKLEDIQRIKSMGPQVAYEYTSLPIEPSRIAPSRGIFSSISLSHYLDQENYFSYNSADVYFETYFSKYILPQATSLKAFSKFLASDTSLPTVFTPVNLSGYFTTSRQQNNFVIRGYPSGIFQARDSALTLGLEYYFPILNIYKGTERLPFFFRRIFGNLVYDVGSFKGLVFDGTSSFIAHDYEDIYSGIGLELHAEITMGHYVPLKLSLGVYNALQKLNGINPNQVFLNLSTPALP